MAARARWSSSFSVPVSSVAPPQALYGTPTLTLLLPLLVLDQLLGLEVLAHRPGVLAGLAPEHLVGALLLLRVLRGQRTLGGELFAEVGELGGLLLLGKGLDLEYELA